MFHVNLSRRDSFRQSDETAANKGTSFVKLRNAHTAKKNYEDTSPHGKKSGKKVHRKRGNITIVTGNKPGPPTFPSATPPIQSDKYRSGWLLALRFHLIIITGPRMKLEQRGNNKEKEDWSEG